MPTGVYERKSGRSTFKCLSCGKEKTIQSYLVKNGQKYCSQICYWKELLGVDPKHLPELKGTIAWNKGLKKDNNKSMAKISIAMKGSNNRGSGENHSAWKGNKVGYAPLHQWLKKQLGKALKCSFNPLHTSKRFEWANISGVYHRDVNDFSSLCTKCHRQYDNIRFRWGRTNPSSLKAISKLEEMKAGGMM